MSAEAHATPIRTPDQRLRVFVSSTLKELEPERRAARAAIERLHLAPVMFELGARPHPPRQLYRAYLEQSDVFVGVYWQEYGWIATGEEISGLEDEYRLAPDEMPKLIYVKQPAEREARLAELITRVRSDDTASYTPFSTAEELAELVAADLATLLAERFDASRAAPAPAPMFDAMPAGRIPAPYSTAVGREGDLATLLGWLGEDAQRLVTLVGPGGIGKSRLAIEVARNAGTRFDRVTFVTLAQVRDPDDVLGAIARELGVRDSGDAPLSEQLGIARAGRRDLIVLDNFEQVVDAAPDVVSLLTDLPGATFLVTSRVRLRVRGEQVFDVEPLGLPPEPSEVSIQAILEAPAVRLFRDRARAADPRFDVTDENAEDVARICRALEGVPLAIELAAARIRALTPAAMLGRLDRVLPLLVTAARDVPERQRTIQATVEWSIDLLGADARALFERLGVFAGDFSLDAVEAVTDGEPWAVDVLGTLLELVDGSLLRQHDDHGVPFFAMLVPVREISAARFELAPDAAAVRRAHAGFYVRLATETELQLSGATQSVALDRLEAERDDLRAGYRHLIAIGEVDVVADAVWRLFLYWWIRGLLQEVRTWMESLLESGRPLSPRTRAIALAFSSWVALWQPDSEIRTEPMEEVVALFRTVGDEFSEGLALTIASLSYMSVTPADLDRRGGAAALGARAGRRATRRHLPLAVRERARAHPAPPRRSRRRRRALRARAGALRGHGRPVRPVHRAHPARMVASHEGRAAPRAVHPRTGALAPPAQRGRGCVCARRTRRVVRGRRRRRARRLPPRRGRDAAGAHGHRRPAVVHHLPVVRRRRARHRPRRRVRGVACRGAPNAATRRARDRARPRDGCGRHREPASVGGGVVNASGRS